MRLTLPEGSQVTTASMPSGELLAAHWASGARHVLSATSEAPSSPLIRAVMPALSALMRWERLRSFATRHLARVRVEAKERPREHSWGHAVVTWTDGETREGWLGLGDAQEYTGAVPAEIARRLLAGEGRPGAVTPAALFGPTSPNRAAPRTCCPGADDGDRSCPIRQLDGPNRLRWMDRPTGQVIRRYERERPGELIHVDIKKLGDIPEGGGHRIMPRRQATGNRQATTHVRKSGSPVIGCSFVHTAIDDHPRLAYSEVLTDERKETAAAFWERANAFFAGHGTTVERVLTDNGSCYRSPKSHPARRPRGRCRRNRRRPTAMRLVVSVGVMGCAGGRGSAGPGGRPARAPRRRRAGCRRSRAR